jgi:uncharacterized Zn-finger protein
MQSIFSSVIKGRTGAGGIDFCGAERAKLASGATQHGVGRDCQEQMNAELCSAGWRSDDANHAKFRNDHGAPEIRIGLREFECIGAAPPHDHPHIYLDMGENDAILCPYCATLFRFDPCSPEQRLR